MKKISKSLIVAIVLLSSFIITYHVLHSTNEDSNIQNLKKVIHSQKIQLEQYNEFSKLLESDLRLKQHFVAAKYSKLPVTDENIKKFLREAEVLNPSESFEVALRETSNGRAGIGRQPQNNHFGMKLATTRFSWKEKIKNTGYAIYASWPYSYLDYNEYISSGYKTWRKDLPKKVTNESKRIKKHLHKNKR